MFTNSSSPKASAAALLSVVSNSILVVLKLIVGFMTGSVSVISEAIHSGVDLLASFIALYAVREASKPADEDHPYGHGKFENISGTVEALLIFVAAGWIIAEAVHKFRSPTVVEMPGIGVAVMLLSSIVNYIVSEILFRVGKKEHSVALEADGWHLRTDVYTSLGVMFGLGSILFAQKFFPSVNLSWIDPVVAICVALLIVKAAYDLTKQAGKDLFDVTLPLVEINYIKNALHTHGSVRGFHHLRSRKAGRDRFVEFHMVVDPDLTVKDSHDITEQITDKLKQRINDLHVIIHVEPCDKLCGPNCLSGCFQRTN